MRDLLDLLGIDTPILQAPMAGVATPELSAAVSNAGALGSVGIGTSPIDRARAMIREVRARTDRPFHVNLFCDPPIREDRARDAVWLAFLAPQFRTFGAEPPDALINGSQSVLGNNALLEMLLEERPPIEFFLQAIVGYPA